MPEPKPARDASHSALPARLLQRFCGFVTLCTGAATIATLAGFAGRWWWVFDLASHFRVQYFWTLMLAALVLACGRRWKQAGIAIGFVMMNLMLIVPAYFGTTAMQGAKAGNHVRALSLNLFSGNRRHDAARKLVRDAQPDLAVFLEFTEEWNEQLSELSSVLPHTHLIPRSGNFGIGLMSRIPFRDVQTEYLSNGNPAIVATFGNDADEWMLIAAHPFPPVGREAAGLRNRQLTRLAEIVQQAEIPVVILGDLNITPWSPHFADFLEAAELQDSGRGFGLQPTWPAGNRLLQIPIDHCLVSSGVLMEERRVGPDVGSDHLPLFVSFATQNRAGRH